VEEAVAEYIEEGVGDYGFYGSFRLKVTPPRAGAGIWEAFIRVRDLNTSSNILIQDFEVAIFRELEGRYNQHYLNTYKIKLDYHHNQNTRYTWYPYKIAYKETVNHMLNGEKTHTFESDIVNFDYDYYYGTGLDFSENYDDHDSDLENGFVVVLAPDLAIGHWEEYIEYGVWDWIAAMGGLLSLTAIVYYWVAHKIAKLAGGMSMGILPGMSFVFSNMEEILYLKRQLRNDVMLATFEKGELRSESTPYIIENTSNGF